MERDKLRQEVLKKEITTKDISFQDIFGIDPKIEEYFIENGYKKPPSILKIKTYNDKYFDLIDNIPTLNSFDYDKKAWMIVSFQEEIKYMIGSISSK